MGYTPYDQSNINPQQNVYPNLESDNSFQQGEIDTTLCSGNEYSDSDWNLLFSYFRFSK